MENEGQEPVAENLQEPGANANSQQENGAIGKVEQLPDWAQKLVKELRSEAAANRKAKSEAEKTAQIAREKELAEQQAWKELADQRQERLSQLEKQLSEAAPLTEKLSKYEEALKKNVDAQLKAVPEMFKPLLDKLDLSEQIEWLSVNSEKLGTTTIAGVPPTPKPNGNMSGVDKAEAQKKMIDMVRNF